MFERNSYLNKITPHINKHIVKILTGMRRTGKSVIIRLLIKHIKEKYLIQDRSILVIDKDLKDFDSIKNHNDLNAHIDDYFKGCKGIRYIFIDEVQLIENWQLSINSYLKSDQYDIYITGSNSSMLSSELSTMVSGRYINIEVFPLSFGEFNNFNNSKFSDTTESFEYYLRYGGMPYLLAYSKEQYEDEIVFQYLKDLYNTIVLKDIIQRHKVRDTEELDRVILFMFDSIGNLTTANNISTYLKSTKSKLSVTSVLNYISYLLETYLMYKCPRYDLLGKKILSINSKYYINDIGLLNSMLGYSFNRINKMLENIIYCEMLQRGYAVKVGNINGNEVDFICEKRDERIYLQVTYQLGNPESETYKREYKSLNSIKDNYPKYILSTEGKIAGKGEDGIIRMNIIEFLLSTPQ
ncbi:MAG: hypothetical protein A2X47_05575 [Lentisphaerae bacterium GWF2_38_69]|nr:MAG: hypothetical protein A2X47_05575 [Lentisphaerae bacterium GWF2_38_69]